MSSASIWVPRGTGGKPWYPALLCPGASSAARDVWAAIVANRDGAVEDGRIDRQLARILMKSVRYVQKGLRALTIMGVIARIREHGRRRIIILVRLAGGRGHPPDGRVPATAGSSGAKQHVHLPTRSASTAAGPARGAGGPAPVGESHRPSPLPATAVDPGPGPVPAAVPDPGVDPGPGDDDRTVSLKDIVAAIDAQAGEPRRVKADPGPIPVPSPPPEAPRVEGTPFARAETDGERIARQKANQERQLAALAAKKGRPGLAAAVAAPKPVEPEAPAKASQPDPDLEPVKKPGLFKTAWGLLNPRRE
jgi:hypothetical protein